MSLKLATGPVNGMPWMVRMGQRPRQSKFLRAESESLSKRRTHCVDPLKLPARLSPAVENTATLPSAQLLAEMDYRGHYRRRSHRGPLSTSNRFLFGDRGDTANAVEVEGYFQSFRKGYLRPSSSHCFREKNEVAVCGYLRNEIRGVSVVQPCAALIDANQDRRVGSRCRGHKHYLRCR